MEPLISLFVFVLLAALILWVTVAILNAIPVRDPIRTVIVAILALGLLLYFVRYLGLL